jgi:hypothetical protein
MKNNNATSRRGCRRIPGGSHLSFVLIAGALLLTANNLFALCTAEGSGPTNVTTLTGGWAANYGNPPYSGYSNGPAYSAEFDFPDGLALDSSGNSLFIADCSNNAVRWISSVQNFATNTAIYSFLYTNDGLKLPVAVAVDGATNVYVLNRANGTNGYILEYNANRFMKAPYDLGNEIFVKTNAIHLTNAVAMTLDGLTNLYVVCNSNTVLRVTPAGSVSVLGVITTNAAVNLRGVAAEDNGQLALTDAGNNGIWQMSMINGSYTAFCGFNGPADTNGFANNAAFNGPENIVKADGGWLVVADRYNNKVKTIDPTGFVSPLFGIKSNYWESDFPCYLPGIADGLVNDVETYYSVMARQPVGLAIAPNGTVYDTEVYYHVIREATSTGLSNSNGIATVIPPLFNGPNGIALDNANANLFIADQFNNAIDELNLGDNQTTVYLTAANGISQPVDVSVGADDDLYVLNQGSGTILEFDQFQNLIATNAAGLTLPTSMTMDTFGNIFVTESGGMILSFNSGISNTVATVTNANVQLQGIGIFTDGTIIVSDAGNDVIWQVNPFTRAVSVFSGQLGQPGSTLGPTNFAKFYQPHKMLLAEGNLAVVADDGNNRIVEMNRAGAVTNALVSTNSLVWFGRAGDPVVPTDYRWKPMTSPVGVALDSSGSVYSSETAYDNLRKISDTGLIQFNPNAPITGTTNTLAPPTITPNSGYYPMGQTIKVNAINRVYYTTDGSTPTTSSPQVPMAANFGTIRWFNSTNDLTSLQLIAISGTNSSAVISGQPVTANNIGTPIGLNPTIQAGIGSSIVIPIVCDLVTNTQVKSFQFRYEIAPVPPNNNPATIEALGIFPTNDFVPVVDAIQGGQNGGYYVTPYTNGFLTNGLVIQNGSNTVFQHFAVVAMLEVDIPPVDNVGNQYALTVLYPSATSDGYDQNVPLTPMTQTYITVTNVPWLVGDTANDAGGAWYNGGTFGDGNLDNSDVNEAFFAASGLRVPYNFSDAFNAMDSYPVDTPGTPGGDGQIRYLDWNTTLYRSLRLNTNDWEREWSPGGNIIDVMTNLLLSALYQPENEKQSANSESSSPWNRQALIGGNSVGYATPGAVVNMPVYAKLQYGSTVGGLQFRALVTPQNNAPGLSGSPQFTNYNGVASPQWSGSVRAGEAAFGWQLVPPSFNFTSDSSNVLGWVSFTIPPTAQAGQTYMVSFENADGAPNLTNEYNFESRSAYVTVEGPAVSPSICSDEWKIYFFGSTTNPLAADNADPDGDGVPNWMEYLAGTDPTDPTSKLQFSGFAKPNGGHASIQWLTAPGKAYKLQWCTSPAGGAWNNLTTIYGNGNATNCVDTSGGGTTRYYRLQLLP